MNYNMPTKVFFGKNALNEASEELSKIGKKCLIVTGQNSAKVSGALDDYLKILKDSDIDYVIFDKVEENPSFETVSLGKKLCLVEGCDFIVGIGGGSPMDAAKAIAMTAGSSIEPEDLYNSSNYSRAFPIVAIALSSGTGSEVTQYSVLTSKTTDVKGGFATPMIFPKIAVLDPTYTYSLSSLSTRNTAIDALSHLIEGLYSNRNHYLMHPYIHYGIKLIIDNLELAMKEPDNYEARKALMQASLYGGIVIAQTGTTLQHSIGYPLTTKFGTPHGLANGIVMEEIFKMNYPHITKQLDDLLAYLKLSQTEFFAWLRKFDLVLNEKLDEDLIDWMTVRATKSSNIIKCPLKITPEMVKQIYRKISL